MLIDAIDLPTGGRLYCVNCHDTVSGLLFGIRGTDLSTWIAAAAVMAAVSVAASLGPAWRASRTDAAEALREAN